MGDERSREEPEAWVAGHTIVAEIVGNVLSVVVDEGSEVSAGDTIVVLESMKMEIPVLTEYDGVVSGVAVHEGDVVQEGDVLAVIDAVKA